MEKRHVKWETGGLVIDNPAVGTLCAAPTYQGAAGGGRWAGRVDVLSGCLREVISLRRTHEVLIQVGKKDK